jgi:hypothetical protein
MRRTLLLAVMLVSMPAFAAQFLTFGDIEVDYSVVNTLFLDSSITSQYGIERGRDRAIVNIAVLDHDGTPIAANVTGTALDLLNHEQPLTFRAIEEPTSVYYLAPLEYTDGDVLRFRIAVRLPNHQPMQLEFQQQMYVAPAP